MKTAGRSGWKRWPAAAVFLACTAVSGPVVAEGEGGAAPEAAAQADDPFVFVVWGHPRGLHAGMPALHLDEVVDTLRKSEAKLLVITGDLITGGPSKRAPTPRELATCERDWDALLAALKPLGVRVEAVPGNHDIQNKATRDLYLKRFKRPPYAFSMRGMRFLMLDSLGVDPQSAEGGASWRATATPFDAKQMAFIKKEMASQEDHAHVFAFMHHVKPWSEPEGFFAQNVHPLLKGGRTRAVFSGTPTASAKYLHDRRDGIDYVLSTTFAAPSPYPMDHAAWSLHHQLDNLQRVTVRGDHVTIDTVVIGETKGHNFKPSYWRGVSKTAPPAPTRAGQASADEGPSTDLLLGIGGGVWAGIMLGLGVAHVRSRRSEDGA